MLWPEVSPLSRDYSFLRRIVTSQQVSVQEFHLINSLKLSTYVNYYRFEPHKKIWEILTIDSDGVLNWFYRYFRDILTNHSEGVSGLWESVIIKVVFNMAEK